MSKDKL